MNENKIKTYEVLNKLGIAVFNADGTERSFNEVMQDLSDLYQKGIELDFTIKRKINFMSKKEY